MFKTTALIVARLIFAGVFAMAAVFKFADIQAFAFHGPSHWEANQMEFGFFVDHFTFLAGLLFAAVHGPGERLAVRAGVLRS